MKTILEYIINNHVSAYTTLLDALDNFIDNELLPLGYTVNTGRGEGNKNEWIDTTSKAGLGKYFRKTEGWEEHYDKWEECFEKIAKKFNLSIKNGPSTVLDDVQVIGLYKGTLRACALLIHPEHIAILYYENVK